MRLRRRKEEPIAAAPPPAGAAAAPPPEPATATATQPVQPAQPPQLGLPAQPAQPAQPIQHAQPPRPPGGPAQPADGLRAWVADLDRRIGIRTYLGAAALILSLAASVVAIVLAVDARDNSASDDDLIRIETELARVSEQATAAATVGEDLESIDGQLSTLEKEVAALTTADRATSKRIEVIEDDIDDLRRQISDLNGRPGGSSP